MPKKPLLKSRVMLSLSYSVIKVRSSWPPPSSISLYLWPDIRYVGCKKNCRIHVYPVHSQKQHADAEWDLFIGNRKEI